MKIKTAIEKVSESKIKRHKREIGKVTERKRDSELMIEESKKKKQRQKR